MIDNGELRPTYKDRISGRSIVIGKKENYVFGVQIDIPITKSVKAYLKSNFDIDIPENITTLSYFDFASDESLETENKVFLSSPGTVLPAHSTIERLVEQEITEVNESKHFQLKREELGEYPIHEFFSDLQIKGDKKDLLNNVLKRLPKIKPP